MTVPPRHEVHHLFERLHEVEPYPTGVIAVPKQIQGTSFFPGGTGLWVPESRELPPLPIGGVMVLGHDFHNVAGWEWSKEHEHENLASPTWRELLKLLEETEVPLDRCFFTNVYMGLREGTGTTGVFPGAKSPEFVERCRQFFLHQIEVQQPSLVLALGAHVPRFLAPLAPQLDVWATHTDFRARDAADVALVDNVDFRTPTAPACTVVTLVHPSFRRRNVGIRRWGGFRGHEAECQLVRTGHNLAVQRIAALLGFGVVGLRSESSRA